MATSGSINGSCTGGAGGKYNFTAEWVRNSFSIDECSSNITINLYVQRNDGYSSSAYNLVTKPGITLKVGGENKEPTKYFLDTRKGAKCKIATWTGDVKHNPDGTLTLAISATFSHSGSESLKGGSLTGNASIDTIPQAASVVSVTCDTKYFDGVITYKYTPKGDEFYNRCVVSLNELVIKTTDLGQKPKAQQTETIRFSAEELGQIYGGITNDYKGSLTVSVHTYSDAEYSSFIGEGLAQSITLEIPQDDNTKPMLEMALTPDTIPTSYPSLFSDVYVQGRSKVSANFNGTGKYGAEIKSYSLKVDGVEIGSPYISDFLIKTGETNVIGTATDSRGFVSEVKQTIYVWPYNKPKLLPISGEREIVCRRCNALGNYSDEGTYLRVKVKRSCSTIKKPDGSDANHCFISLRCKAKDDVWNDRMWTVILPAQNEGNKDEIDTWDEWTLGVSYLATNTAYDVEIMAKDYVGETYTLSFSIPTDKIYDHEAPHMGSYGFGKFVEEDNSFDIAEDKDLIVRTAEGVVTRIKDTGWKSIGLADGITAYDVGNTQGGCFYRVINKKHVYVSFGCGTNYTGTVVINQTAIPTEYLPRSTVNRVVPTNVGAATVSVNGNGQIIVNSTETVSWIDGYIDYWID